MSLESLQSYLADDMHAVDHVIRQSLHSDVALIRQVSEYIINSGGKRLRPALVLLSAGCFNYSGRAHYELAAVVEFIHTATLLHDDVVVESTLRRGRATANQTFGNAASVCRCGCSQARAPLTSSSRAGRRRLPPAEMMYWATSRTRGTSVVRRSWITRSTAAMSARISSSGLFVDKARDK